LAALPPDNERYDRPQEDRPYRGGVVTHSFRLFSLRKDHQVAVLTIGTSHPHDTNGESSYPRDATASNFDLISNREENRYMYVGEMCRYASPRTEAEVRGRPIEARIGAMAENMARHCQRDCVR